MSDYSVGEAAGVLGVSSDTVRRWIDNGSLDASRTDNGRRRIEGVALARFAQSMHEGFDPLVTTTESIRNHFTGIVTKVTKDKVMAQVELQAGPFRVVAGEHWPSDVLAGYALGIAWTTVVLVLGLPWAASRPAGE